MKAITLYQPWASLAAIGAKGYETRSWATNYRGRIAIHAGISLNHLRGELSARSISAVQHALFEESIHVDMWSNIAQLLPRGAVIATAELTGCHKIVRYGGRGMSSTDPGWLETEKGIYEPSENEILFGDWTPGRYAWELRNVTLLPEPLPHKGFQRLWDIPDEVIEAAMKKPTLEVDECPR